MCTKSLRTVSTRAEGAGELFSSRVLTAHSTAICVKCKNKVILSGILAGNLINIVKPLQNLLLLRINDAKLLLFAIIISCSEASSA